VPWRPSTGCWEASTKGAAGQILQKVFDLPGIERDVIERDDRLHLPEKLGALLGGGLGGRVGGVELADEALEHIAQPLAARVHIDARASGTVVHRIAREVPQEG
jgi:hypothetical protein